MNKELTIIIENLQEAIDKLQQSVDVLKTINQTIPDLSDFKEVEKLYEQGQQVIENSIKKLRENQ